MVAFSDARMAFAVASAVAVFDAGLAFPVALAVTVFDAGLAFPVALAVTVFDTGMVFPVPLLDCSDAFPFAFAVTVLDCFDKGVVLAGTAFAGTVLAGTEFDGTLFAGTLFDGADKGIDGAIDMFTVNRSDKGEVLSSGSGRSGINRPFIDWGVVACDGFIGRLGFGVRSASPSSGWGMKIRAIPFVN